ncbi:MAG: glycosyltransferase [Thermoanaerobaculales bacterium]|jgi:glycosyltransferase involved in cell wall biosynthesis|nr:glycosyltransferase [Thermoanaerobaculales bacterium]
MSRHSDTPKILWGSPLPPVRSGVADYAAELLPELAKAARLRVLRPPEWTPPPEWPHQLETVPCDEERQDDEIEVVHLGNNPYHLWLLHRLRRGGVVVVLHDAVLHHLLVEDAAEGGAAAADLESELERSHGQAGRALSAARTAGHHGFLDPFLFPARASFFRYASAVIVHSRWAAELVRSEVESLPVHRVELAAADPGPLDRAAIRRRFGIPDQERVLMHLGFLTRQKGLEEILTGFGAAVRCGVQARLMIVGEGRRAEHLKEAARSAGLEDRVWFTGWIKPEHFLSVPAAADLGVVLRTPSAGETSAAVLRFLACGVPVAVGGRKQFLEWPEAAAPRLTPGPAAAPDLARLLGDVGGPGWDDRRQAARAAYERFHRPEDIARRFVGILSNLKETS